MNFGWCWTVVFYQNHLLEHRWIPMTESRKLSRTISESSKAKPSESGTSWSGFSPGYGDIFVLVTPVDSNIIKYRLLQKQELCWESSQSTRVKRRSNTYWCKAHRANNSHDEWEFILFHHTRLAVPMCSDFPTRWRSGRCAEVDALSVLCLRGGFRMFPHQKVG